MSKVFGIIIDEDRCLSAILGRSRRVLRDDAFEKLVSVSDEDDTLEDALDKGAESWSLYFGRFSMTPVVR